MKKSFNFISMLMILITLFSGFFTFSNQDKVKAEESRAVLDFYGSGNNQVVLYEGGKVEVTYTYGFTELLVFIQNCSKENADGTCETWAKIDGKIAGYVYHKSGRHKSDSTPKTVTYHLYQSSYVNVGDPVKVNIVIDFLYSSTKPNLLHCNVDAEIEGCERSKNGQGKYTQTKKQKSVVGRIDDYEDKKGIVVRGSDYDTLGVVYGTAIDNSHKINGESFVIDNTEFDDAQKGVEGTVKDIVNVCLVCIALAFGVTVAVIGVKIVKSADEPQERMEALKKLRNITIGLVLAFLVVWAMPTIVKYIEKLL